MRRGILGLGCAIVRLRLLACGKGLKVLGSMNVPGIVNGVVGVGV